MIQHIITRRASLKNSAKEVVDYTVDGVTKFKFVANMGHTRKGFEQARNLALDASYGEASTVVIRDLR